MTQNSTTQKKGSEVFYYPKKLPERQKLLPKSVEIILHEKEKWWFVEEYNDD